MHAFFTAHPFFWLLVHFQKIIGYQRGNNFAGSPIPITTPIVVELFIDDKFDEFDPDRKVSFRSGFKVYWRLDSSVAVSDLSFPTLPGLALFSIST